MNKLLPILILSFLTITAFSQNEEEAISHIRIDYQYSSEVLPELYEIHYKSKKVHYIDPEKTKRSGEAKVKKKKMNRKKWSAITYLIDRLCEDSLSFQELTPDNYCKFSFQVHYTIGEVKNLVIETEETIDILHKLRLMFLPEDKTIVVKAFPDYYISNQ